MSGRHSEVDLGELSYNERRIMHELLVEKQSTLRASIVAMQAELEFVDDLVERTEQEEDK